MTDTVMADKVVQCTIYFAGGGSSQYYKIKAEYKPEQSLQDHFREILDWFSAKDSPDRTIFDLTGAGSLSCMGLVKSQIQSIFIELKTTA